jgi:DNA invertase Pin-like site-specific DNA recombinase
MRNRFPSTVTSLDRLLGTVSGPIAISYWRWSTPEQTRGHSGERQLDLSRRWAESRRIHLVEIVDPGVSAYYGRNRSEGALASFLAYVEAGKIPEGSFLLIETFDRLSREELFTALNLFLRIISYGITIVTLRDGQEFNRETLNEAIPTRLLTSILAMSLAHQESRLKSERISATWEKRRQVARARQIPMSANCPGWLRISGEGDNRQLEPIPERVAIIRRIFDETVRGLGHWKIAERLNLDGAEAYRSKKGWNPSSVRKIQSNESVIGIFQPHKKIGSKRIPEGDPIIGYFPAIIEEAQFWQAQEVIRKRDRHSAGPKGPTYANLLRTAPESLNLS